MTRGVQNQSGDELIVLDRDETTRSIANLTRIIDYDLEIDPQCWPLFYDTVDAAERFRALLEQRRMTGTFIAPPGVPESLPLLYLRGSWLTLEETDAYFSVVKVAHAVTTGQCESLVDAPRVQTETGIEVVEPEAVEEVMPDFPEPLSVPQLQGSSSGGSTTFLVGLALATTVLGAVWLLFKGRR